MFSTEIEILLNFTTLFQAQI